MTVCIGALCEGGASVVVAADRMMTFGPPMNLQTEPPGLKKIVELTDTSVLLFSGGVAEGEEVISQVKQPAKGQRVLPVAELVKLAYANLKKKRVEETMLTPLLGCDFAGFRSLLTQSASSQILQQLVGLIGQHNLQLELIIAGVDDSIGHLYVIAHPGQLLSIDTMGFGAIGTGGLHANVRLSLEQHTKGASLEEAVYNVYDAKKASEVAPGVGKLTDMAIIKRGGVTFLTDAVLDVLEKVRKKEKSTLTSTEREHLKRTCDGLLEKK